MKYQAEPAPFKSNIDVEPRKKTVDIFFLRKLSIGKKQSVDACLTFTLFFCPNQIITQKPFIHSFKLKTLRMNRFFVIQFFCFLLYRFIAWYRHYTWNVFQYMFNTVNEKWFSRSSSHTAPLKQQSTIYTHTIQTTSSQGNGIWYKPMLNTRKKNTNNFFSWNYHFDKNCPFPMRLCEANHSHLPNIMLVEVVVTQAQQ